MGTILNKNLAIALQERGFLLELIGFFLVFIEMFSKSAPKIIEETVHELSNFENLLDFIIKEDIGPPFLKRVLILIFKGKSKYAFTIFKLSISIVIMAISAWFFAVIDGDIMLYFITFSPVLSFCIILGGAPIVSFFRNDSTEIKIEGVIASLVIYFGAFIYGCVTEGINESIKIVVGLFLSVALAAIFFTMIKIVSKLLFYLEDLSDGRAIGVFGFIVTSVGLIFGSYQIAVLWWG